MTKRTLAYTPILVASLTLLGCAAPTDADLSDDSSLTAEEAQSEDAPDVLAQQSLADRLRAAIDEARKAFEQRGGGALPAPGGGGPAVGDSTGPVAVSGPQVTGNGGVVNATIVVKKGTTFNGQGKRFTAGRALGNGSQDEGQKPVFKLEDGARLVNVVLGAPAADGIHTYGNVTLENIVWEDIGEDALTIKESGTVVLNGGSARNGDDKVFQINAASTFKVSNFKADKAGKFIRQNGGTTFKVDVVIDRCDISNMKESIFRTDSRSSTVTMTNTRYSNIGKELFMGVGSNNIRQSGNTRY